MRLIFSILFFILSIFYLKAETNGNMLDFSHLELLISREEINQEMKNVAKKIDENFMGKDMIFVPIMKGALCFAADLIRAIDSNLILEPIRCSSYGKNGVNRGELTIFFHDNIDVDGKDILLVDDIYDSGNTCTTLANYFYEKGAASVQIAVMLYKKSSYKIDDAICPDYYLFEIDNHFVIGYGLDYKERYRGLDGIYRAKGDFGSLPVK